MDRYEKEYYIAELRSKIIKITLLCVVIPLLFISLFRLTSKLSKNLSPTFSEGEMEVKISSLVNDQNFILVQKHSSYIFFSDNYYYSFFIAEDDGLRSYEFNIDDCYLNPVLEPNNEPYAKIEYKEMGSTKVFKKAKLYLPKNYIIQEQ